MLGIDYDASEEERRTQFLDDFASCVQFTYRKGFATPIRLITGQDITSDAGWGCMLRATQMMLAQCFLSLVLGRDWRYNAERDLAEGSVYVALLSCFLDIPSAPFSIHNLVTAGQQQLGKEPSAWFGPTSAAQSVGHIFGRLASSDESLPLPDSLHGMACAVFVDGAIYQETVLGHFSSGSKAVAILVCRRLGLDAFNVDEYRPGLEACFELPEFQGLASGNSASSAHFFVGTHDDCLLFLDPHRTQPALETVDDIRHGASETGLQGARPLPLRWSRLNASICLCFLVTSPEGFLELCSKLCNAPRSDVIEILEREPCYDGHHEMTATEEGDMVLLD